MTSQLKNFMVLERVLLAGIQGEFFLLSLSCLVFAEESATIQRL